MIGILIVSHGGLADALISEVQFLTGSVQKVKGISIRPKETGEEIKNRIYETLEELDDGDGVIILTDALGGTPTNASLPFLNDRRVEVVTGVNVPMLLALSSYRKGRPLEEISTLAKKAGRRSIVVAKRVLGLKPSVAGKISRVSSAQKTPMLTDSMRQGHSIADREILSIRKMSTESIREEPGKAIH